MAAKGNTEFSVENEGESEATLKRYEIEGQNVILYFDQVSFYDIKHHPLIHT